MVQSNVHLNQQYSRVIPFLSSQALVSSFVACLCVVGIGLLQFPRLQYLIRSNKTVTKETLEKQLQAEQVRLIFLKKMPSFGYKNMIANWTYLNFIQYFGDDEVRAKTGYSLSPEYFEIILKQDPRFLDAYLALSTSTSMFAGKPERSVSMIARGLKSLSPMVPAKSYYAWRYKGIDQLLFLGDSPGAKKSFEKSVEWASKHNDEESKLVENISQRTADFLSRNPNSVYAQIATWGMVLNNDVDDKTKQIAISRIEALGGKVESTPQGNKIKLPPKD